VQLEVGDVVEIGPFQLTYAQTTGVVQPVVAKMPTATGHTPSEPPPPRANGALPAANGDEPMIPPGLSPNHSRLLAYLPGIYHTEFMTRFLAMFEAILTPIEWHVDNFDLYLDAGTAPITFLNWFAQWFSLEFDHSWSEAQKRTLLKEAHIIFARRGTAWSLSRLLEIYLDEMPEIEDTARNLPAFTFIVRIPRAENDVDGQLIRNLIDANKPAHTTYELVFTGG
jgi:phage tail-like protein